MKTLKLSLIGTAAAVVAVGLGANAFAFHSGGVAECSGCHSMHAPATGGSNLLVGTDPSSTCLSCHENSADTGPSSYHISTAESKLGPTLSPLQRTPGGDFSWLKKTYTYVLRGATLTEDGATHGHNIVAVDKNYAADATNTVAPGGTFAAANLGCNSCHNPHNPMRRGVDGNITNGGAPIIGSGSYNTSAVPVAGQAVGAYRLLAGLGYSKGGVTFTGVPAAVTNSTYNRTEAVTPTRTAYAQKNTGGHATWGQWCSTCHPSMHTSSGNMVHPVDVPLGSDIASNYNAYVSSGIMTGTAATAYTSLVPFASSNLATYANLQALAVTTASAGPASTDQVMCLSCHRAHASGFPEMLRWNMENEFITKTDATSGLAAYGTGQGRTEAEWVAAYYDRPATSFGGYQRLLCNKCHAKD